MPFFDVKNFSEYTLETEDVYTAAFLYAVILAGVCVGSKTYFPEPKRLAWCVGLVNSVVTMVVGAIYTAVRLNLTDYSSEDFNYRSFFHGVDNVSALVCLWFAMANICDLGFGLVFYRKYLGVLTAYIHHTVFIWMMLTAVTGNGIFVQTEPFSPSFTYMLIEELPTMLLALGTVLPQFRTDIGFGVTFFLLRIVYHISVMASAASVGCTKFIIVLYGLTLLLHINWFYTWVTKYGAKTFKTGQKEKDK